MKRSPPVRQGTRRVSSATFPTFASLQTYGASFCDPARREAQVARRRIVARVEVTESALPRLDARLAAVGPLGLLTAPEGLLVEDVELERIG